MKRNSILSWNIVEFNSVASTQDIARKLAHSGECEGTVILARHQTTGRGREGRVWHSPKDAGIWATMLLRPELEAKYLPLLPVLVSVSIARAVELTTGITTSIKWPNDVCIGGKKLAGVLCEVETDPERKIVFVLAGFGVNLFTPEGGFSVEISHRATSIELETGKRVNPDEMLDSILSACAERYEKLLSGKPGSIVKEVADRDALRGSCVRVKIGDRVVEGICEGIGETGGLILVDNEGQMSEFVSGEIVEFIR